MILVSVHHEAMLLAFAWSVLGRVRKLHKLNLLPKHELKDKNKRRLPKTVAPSP